jgi:hypothetical protein
VIEQMTVAGRAAGLNQAEIRATLKSALTAGKRNPLEPRRTREHETPRTLSTARFAAIAESLLERLPVEQQPDVLAMIVARRLELGLCADVFALPRPPEQQALLKELAEQFGRDDLARTGLLKRTPTGDPDLRRFAWPEHRWCVIWRDPDRDAQTIERRYTGDRDTERRWVFPAQRGPEWPLGWHLLASAEPERLVVVVEGPSDYFAARAMAFARCRDGAQQMPLIVALASATKLRSEWLPALARRRVFVALDGDEAGERASNAILEQLRVAEIECERTRPPEDVKDWAEARARDCKMSESQSTTEARYVAGERAAVRQEKALG